VAGEQLIDEQFYYSPGFARQLESVYIEGLRHEINPRGPEIASSFKTPILWQV